MRFDPDDHRYRYFDLLDLYQNTHQELFALTFYQLDPGDRSQNAQDVRLAIAECHGALRALSFALTGRESIRIGEFTAPFVGLSMSLN